MYPSMLVPLGMIPQSIWAAPKCCNCCFTKFQIGSSSTQSGLLLIYSSVNCWRLATARSESHKCWYIETHSPSGKWKVLKIWAISSRAFGFPRNPEWSIRRHVGWTCEISRDGPQHKLDFCWIRDDSVPMNSVGASKHVIYQWEEHCPLAYHH